MTKQEASELENICDKLMSYYMKEECCVSLALTGRLKIEFDDNFINVNTKTNSVDYVRYVGPYDDLQDCIGKALLCINENKGIFDKLIWSYEHITELT